MILFDEFSNQPTELSLNAIISYYNSINITFIGAINKIESILNKKKIEPIDIEFLKSLDVTYHSLLISEETHEKFGNDIRKAIVKATLLQSYYLTLGFFDGRNEFLWNDKLNEYKIKFIKYGFETEFILDFINNLELNLKRMCSEYELYAIEDSTLHLEELYNLQEYNDKAAEEKDLFKKKQIYVDAIVDSDLFCLELDLEPEEEEIHQVFMLKCKKAIDIIDFQISSSQPQESKELKYTELLTESNSIAPKFKLASKRKTDFFKLISAMYDLRMFETKDGYIASNKQEIMNEFGKILGEDFGTYSTYLSMAKKAEKEIFMKTFKDIEKKGAEYYDKENEK